MKQTSIVTAIALLAVGCSSTSAPSNSPDGGTSSCGSTTTAPGTVSLSGTLGGTTPAASEAVAVVATGATSSSGRVSYVGIALSSATGTCGRLQGAHFLGLPFGLANASSLTLYTEVPGVSSIAPGTYDVTTATSAPLTNAVYSSVDAQCATRASQYGTTGTLTLTQVDCTTVAGSFDVQLTDSHGTLNDHVTGTFSAPVCAADLFGAGDAGVFGGDAAACSAQ